MGRISNLRKFLLVASFAVISSGSAPSCWGFAPVARPKRRTAHGRGSLQPPPSWSFPFMLAANPNVPKEEEARGDPSSRCEAEEVAKDPQETSSVLSGRPRRAWWRRITTAVNLRRPRFVAIARTMVVFTVVVSVAVWFLPYLWMACKFIVTTVGYALRELWRGCTVPDWAYEERFGRLPPGANPKTFGKTRPWKQGWR